MAAARVVLHASCADAPRHNSTWCSATANRRSLCNELEPRTSAFSGLGRAGRVIGARGGLAAAGAEAAAAAAAAPLLHGAAWTRTKVRFNARGSPGVWQWRYFSVFDCPGAANGSRAPPPLSRGTVRGGVRGRALGGVGGGAAEQVVHARMCMLHKDKAHETTVVGLSSSDGRPPPVHRNRHGQSQERALMAMGWPGPPPYAHPEPPSFIPAILASSLSLLRSRGGRS